MLKQVLSMYKGVLIDLFEKIQSIQSHPMEAIEECCNIQQKLVDETIKVENAIRTGKNKISDMKAQLRVRHTKEESKKIKDDIGQYKAFMEDLSDLLHIFKSIGDAIAFTYIERWDIKPMAFKESPGFISGKEGFDEEIKIFNENLAEGKIAILNDLTHNLRYGDITIIEDLGKYKLLEVKSGRQKGKSHKNQSKKFDVLNDYLVRDVSTDLVKDQMMIRLSIHAPEKHHRDLINVLLKQALVKSSSDLVEVEKGLFYYVDTEDNQIIDPQILYNKIQEKIKEPLPFFITANKYDVPGYLPFIWIFNDSNASLAFYEDYLMILVFLDLNYLKEKFNARGFDLEYFGDLEYCLYVKNKGYNDDFVEEMYVNRYLFNRFFLEFIELDWFIDEIIYRMNKRHHQENIDGIKH